MNSLPPELQLMIFELLPVEDTIRLQLVSKQWYCLLNSLKHQQLKVVGAQECWELNSRPLKSVYTVNCVENDLLITPMSPLFRSVKKLSTHFYSEQIIDLTQFYNQFSKLEELTCYNYSHVGNTIILNLQHLNKLTIDCYSRSFFDLRTPCLTYLWIWDLGNCYLYFPDRLRRLETFIFNQEKFNVSQLKNLEFLRISGSEWSVITNSLLMKLSGLKELHFGAAAFLNRDTLNSSFTYRRNGLRIYLYGFDIDQNVEADEKFPYGDEKSVSKFIVKNYEKTAEKVLHCDLLRVEYNELIKAGLKNDFFLKFPKLEGVKIIEKLEDEEALLEFLTKTKPSIFSMEKTLLTQKILHKIALNCDIRELELMKMDLDVMCPEFDFIYKMENLEVIRVHQTISIDFLLTAFQMCKNIIEVEFVIVPDLDRAIFGYTNRWGFVTMLSHVVADEINENFVCFWANLYFDSELAFLHFLGALRKELDPNPNDLRKLMFLINDLEYNEMLVRREVRRILKNEVIYIHNKPF